MKVLLKRVEKEATNDSVIFRSARVFKNFSEDLKIAHLSTGEQLC